jgi:hypothetical protein
MARSIVQIIPAAGWRARFDGGKRKSTLHAKPFGNAGFYTEPLACWALVENLASREIVGMLRKSVASEELGLGFADEEAGFSGYEPN